MYLDMAEETWVNLIFVFPAVVKIWLPNRGSWQTVDFV